MTRPTLSMFGAAGAVVGAVGIPVGAALPWILSGSAKKSAFSLAKSARELGLASAADDLGIANETVVRVLLWTLFSSPMLAGVIVLLLAFGKRNVVAIFSVLSGLIGVVAGAAGVAVNDTSLSGPRVTLLAGVCALGGAVCLFAHRLRQRS